jgi:hypothetical protein
VRHRRKVADRHVKREERADVIHLVILPFASKSLLDYEEKGRRRRNRVGRKAKSKWLIIPFLLSK